MRFRRLMAASMAGIMAVSSAIVCQISASAESDSGNVNIDDITLYYTDDINKLDYKELTISGDDLAAGIGHTGAIVNSVTSVTINYEVTGSSDVDVTVAHGSDEANGWWAEETKTYSGTGTFTLQKPVSMDGTNLTLKFKVDDSATALASSTVKITSIDIEATYVDEMISASNFKYSVLKNEEMEIGDSFTITYDSNKTPAASKYRFKYEYKDSSDTTQYYEVLSDTGEIDNSIESIVGVKLTNEGTVGTVTTYKFTATGASKYAFQAKVEYSTGGTWTQEDTSYPWFGDISYKVLPATHNITVSSAITNGKVTAEPKTAAADEEVTLTVTPDKGYKLKADSLKVTKKGDPATTVAVTDNKFVMRDYDVEVSAEFEKIAVESVSVKAATSITVGGTETLVAKVTPDDAFDASVKWKSSDTAVATVDENGKVTAVKAGTADITATTSNGKTATCTVTVKAAPEKLEGAFEYAYDGSPIELTVGKATWNDSGLAAQKNASLEMKGVTFKTTTFGELKKLYSGIVINNLEIKNVPEGIKADEISVCIFIKSGSGWSWNSFNGTSVNFADITKISDSDAIMEVGYQLNYDIPAGTSYKTGDTITVNAKEEVVDPNAVIISPSTKVQQVDVKTDKNGNVTEQIAYFAISEKDAKTCESYIVTITRGKDNKKLVREIKNCFKTVQYKAADGSDKTVVAADGAYCVLLDITNIGSDYGALTIKIEPKK